MLVVNQIKLEDLFENSVAQLTIMADHRKDDFSRSFTGLQGTSQNHTARKPKGLFDLAQMTTKQAARSDLNTKHYLKSQNSSPKGRQTGKFSPLMHDFSDPSLLTETRPPPASNPSSFDPFSAWSRRISQTGNAISAESDHQVANPTQTDHSYIKFRNTAGDYKITPTIAENQNSRYFLKPASSGVNLNSQDSKVAPSPSGVSPSRSNHSLLQNSNRSGIFQRFLSNHEHLLTINQNQYNPHNREAHSKSNLCVASLARGQTSEGIGISVRRVEGTNPGASPAQQALKDILGARGLPLPATKPPKLSQTTSVVRYDSPDHSHSAVHGSSGASDPDQPNAPHGRLAEEQPAGHVSYTPLKNALASITARRQRDNLGQISPAAGNNKVLCKMNTQAPRTPQGDYSFGEQQASNNSQSYQAAGRVNEAYDLSSESILQSSGRKVKRLVINVRMDPNPLGSPNARTVISKAQPGIGQQKSSSHLLQTTQLAEKGFGGVKPAEVGSKVPLTPGRLQSTVGGTNIQSPNILGSDLLTKLLNKKNISSKKSTPNSPKTVQISKNVSVGSNLLAREPEAQSHEYRSNPENLADPTSAGDGLGNQLRSGGQSSAAAVGSKFSKVFSHNYFKQVPATSHNSTRVEATEQSGHSKVLQPNFFKHKVNMIEALKLKLRETSAKSRQQSRRPSAVSGDKAHQKETPASTLGGLKAQVGSQPHKLHPSQLQGRSGPQLHIDVSRLGTGSPLNSSKRSNLEPVSVDIRLYDPMNIHLHGGGESPTSEGSRERATKAPTSLKNLKEVRMPPTKDTSSMKIGTQISYLTTEQAKTKEFVIPLLAEVSSQEMLDELTISASEKSGLVNSRVNEVLQSSILEAPSRAVSQRIDSPHHGQQLLEQVPRLEWRNSAVLEGSAASINKPMNLEISYHGTSSAVQSMRKSGTGDVIGQRSPSLLSPGLKSSTKAQEGPTTMKNIMVMPVKNSFVSGEDSDRLGFQSTPQDKGTLAHSQTLGLQNSPRSAYKRAQYGADYAVQEINKRGRPVYPQITALNLSACHPSNPNLDSDDSPVRDLPSSDARWVRPQNSSRVEHADGVGMPPDGQGSPLTKRSSRHRQGKSVDLEPVQLIGSTARGKRPGLAHSGLPNPDFQTVRKSLHNSEDCASVSMNRGMASGSAQGTPLNYQLSKRNYDSIENEEDHEIIERNRSGERPSVIEDEQTDTTLEADQTLQRLLNPEVTENSEARSHLIRSIKDFFEKQSEIFGQDYQTTLANYELVKCIGKGNFGKVYLGKQVLTDSPVAIKILHKKTLAGDAVERSKVENEIVLLVMCNPFKNVISLLEVFETKDYYFLVFEHAAEGDLINHLKTKGVMKEPQARNVLSCLVNALQDMHRLGIVHRDIKLDNVLCNSQGKYMLADLGISKKVGMYEMLRDKAGTPAYMAPEIIQGTSYRGFEADIWAAGVLLFTIVYGRIPFKAEDIQQVQKRILTEEVVFPAKPETSSDFKDLVRRMLAKDPRKRASLAEIKSHKWLEAVPGSREHSESTIPALPRSHSAQVCRDIVVNFGFPANYVQESIAKDVLNHATACYLALQHAIGA